MEGMIVLKEYSKKQRWRLKNGGAFEDTKMQVTKEIMEEIHRRFPQAQEMLNSGKMVKIVDKDFVVIEAKVRLAVDSVKLHRRFPQMVSIVWPENTTLWKADEMPPRMSSCSEHIPLTWENKRKQKRTEAMNSKKQKAGDSEIAVNDDEGDSSDVGTAGTGSISEEESPQPRRITRNASKTVAVMEQDDGGAGPSEPSSRRRRQSIKFYGTASDSESDKEVARSHDKGKAKKDSDEEYRKPPMKMQKRSGGMKTRKHMAPVEASVEMESSEEEDEDDEDAVEVDLRLQPRRRGRPKRVSNVENAEKKETAAKKATKGSVKPRQEESKPVDVANIAFEPQRYELNIDRLFGAAANVTTEKKTEKREEKNTRKPAEKKKPNDKTTEPESKGAPKTIPALAPTPNQGAAELTPRAPGEPLAQRQTPLPTIAQNDFSRNIYANVQAPPAPGAQPTVGIAMNGSGHYPAAAGMVNGATNQNGTGAQAATQAGGPPPGAMPFNGPALGQHYAMPPQYPYANHNEMDPNRYQRNVRPHLGMEYMANPQGNAAFAAAMERHFADPGRYPHPYATMYNDRAQPQHVQNFWQPNTPPRAPNVQGPFNPPRAMLAQGAYRGPNVPPRAPIGPDANNARGMLAQGVYNGPFYPPGTVVFNRRIRVTQGPYQGPFYPPQAPIEQGIYNPGNGGAAPNPFPMPGNEGHNDHYMNGVNVQPNEMNAEGGAPNANVADNPDDTPWAAIHDAQGLLNQM